MSQSHFLRTIFCASLVTLTLSAALLTGMAYGQTPEGPQIPPQDTQIGAVHGQIRLGYYLSTHTYRYQGEYEVATNFARLAGSPLYVFGDVNVQALQDSHGKFAPSRLTGTFEAGAHRLFGVAPLSFTLRHQSAHYIDRSDLFQGSWDMFGVRWQQTVGSTQLSGSLAKYVHVHQLDAIYTVDADLQGVTALGKVGHYRCELHSDIHATAAHDGNSGFTDYWIEPNLFLSAQTAAFLGYGQIHDTNLSIANTDHPVIGGIRLVY
jgi:hypothetical protein